MARRSSLSHFGHDTSQEPASRTETLAGVQESAERCSTVRHVRARRTGEPQAGPRLPGSGNAAEQVLGPTFPRGYRKYLTELGTGYLNESLEVLLAQVVLNILENTREGWRACYSWDNPEVLPPEDLLQCVPRGKW